MSAPWDVTPDDLAAFVIAQVGERFARHVRDVFAIEHDPARRGLTSSWYWGGSSNRWPALDAVVGLNRYDELRRMTVVGLVAALGPVREITYRPKRGHKPPMMPGEYRLRAHVSSPRVDVLNVGRQID